MGKPNNDEVKRCLEKWLTLENYVLQESSLKKLFIETYPKNDNIDDVLIKVCALNNFYSTNIFSPFTVAKHIVSLNIDQNLDEEDLQVVNKIAKVKMSNESIRNFYSFASKYCSHHKPKVYPIYDSFAEKMLLEFKKQDKFHRFVKEDLKDFSNYKSVIMKFREFYKLDLFDLKEIDRYLWIAGKEKFGKN